MPHPDPGPVGADAFDDHGLAGKERAAVLEGAAGAVVTVGILQPGGCGSRRRGSEGGGGCGRYGGRGAGRGWLGDHPAHRDVGVGVGPEDTLGICGAQREQVGAWGSREPGLLDVGDGLPGLVAAGGIRVEDAAVDAQLEAGDPGRVAGVRDDVVLCQG